MMRLLLLLAACSSVNSLSDDVYRRQQRAAAFEVAGNQPAADAERRHIQRDQARLQHKEAHVPSYQFPQ